MLHFARKDEGASESTFETTLEVCDGKIARQVDVVFAGAQADRKEGISQQNTRSNPRAKPHPGVDAPCQTAVYGQAGY